MQPEIQITKLFIMYFSPLPCYSPSDATLFFISSLFTHRSKAFKTELQSYVLEAAACIVAVHL